tara:strand:+ start:1678 stop:2046 length:369 start_codon:yes stop_codon:yes gene_type:complete
MAYKNKEDQSAASKRHYEANKSKIKERSKKRNRKQRNANRAYVDKIKVQSSCVDCGESNPLVLDFDHVKGEKVGDISSMVYQSYCVESIQREIDKCEVRCSNCHRVATHNRRIEKQNAEDNS